MNITQKFKQLLTPISKLLLFIAFLLPPSSTLNSVNAGESSEKQKLQKLDRKSRITELCGSYMIFYRRKHNVKAGNVACFEYEVDGKRMTITAASVSRSGEAVFEYRDRRGKLIKRVSRSRISGKTVINKHSEKLIFLILQEDGIDSESVSEILTDRKPCDRGGAYCKNLLEREFPNAHIGYFANYERGGYLEGNAELARLIEEEDKEFFEFLRLFDSKPVALSKPTSSSSPQGSTVSQEGALIKSLANSSGSMHDKSSPGGIDFSTLELRYIAEDSSLLADRGLKYAFNATPAAGNKNLNAGRIAAVQASDAFFVWLSLTPDKFWVNLNPNEPDRIIDPQFGKTDAGRILLQSDFQMKKTVAEFIHPDSSLGKQFWQQLKRGPSGGTCISFRQWIVPAPATVHNDKNGIYITDAPLNVKLESQYFQSKGRSDLLAAACAIPDKKNEAYNESIYRKLILPRIEQAVNQAPEYAELRRVYRSRVAAEWYRLRSASNATTYREMVNNGNVSSWPARQNWSPRQVFDQYVDSVNKGEFHVVHTNQWQDGNMIYTQKQFYVYGGVDFSRVFFKQLSSTDFQKTWGDLRQVMDNSMKSPVADRSGKIWLGGSTITSRAIWKTFWFYLALGFLALPFIIRWKRSYKKRLL